MQNDARQVNLKNEIAIQHNLKLNHNCNQVMLMTFFLYGTQTTFNLINHLLCFGLVEFLQTKNIPKQ